VNAKTQAGEPVGRNFQGLAEITRQKAPPMLGRVMETIPWYTEATLFTSAHLRRAGTLIQCVRKWGCMSALEQAEAHLKVSVAIDGLYRLDPGQIAALMDQPGYLTA
jgi:hypothetical protein